MALINQGSTEVESKEPVKGFMYHETDAPEGMLFTDAEKAELKKLDGWVDTPAAWFKIEAPKDKVLKSSDIVKTTESKLTDITEELLDKAVKAMLESKTDLTRKGRPELPALKEKCGFDVSKDELTASMKRLEG